MRASVRLVYMASETAFICEKKHFKRRVFPLLRPSSRMVASCACPSLSVKPTRGLVDEKLQVVVTNLNPNQEVTLHCLHHSEDKDFWEAFGHYVSDEQGTLTGTN